MDDKTLNIGDRVVIANSGICNKMVGVIVDDKMRFKDEVLYIVDKKEIITQLKEKQMKLKDELVEICMSGNVHLIDGAVDKLEQVQKNISLAEQDGNLFGFLGSELKRL